MAERRMFAKTIVLSDAFLDMPLSARCLYFTLGMLADDDGFVNSPKSIMRQAGASVDDLNLLMAKRFILAFDSGVIVIKHWRINNYLRSDRYTETKYLEEKQYLDVDKNGAYHVGIPNDGIPVGIPSIGKDSLVDDSKEIYGDVPQAETSKPKRTVFTPPSLEEVRTYCRDRQNDVDPERFIDYYTARGWNVGKNKMKDWKAAVRTWERSGYNNKEVSNNGCSKAREDTTGNPQQGRYGTWL